MWIELLNVFGPLTAGSSYDNTENDILINGLAKFESNNGKELAGMQKVLTLLLSVLC